jgi:hypothetical protein
MRVPGKRFPSTADDQLLFYQNLIYTVLCTLFRTILYNQNCTKYYKVLVLRFESGSAGETDLDFRRMQRLLLK